MYWVLRYASLTLSWVSRRSLLEPFSKIWTMDRAPLCRALAMWSGIWSLGCPDKKEEGFFFINSTIGRHYFTTRALSRSFSDHCFTLNNGSFLPNFELKQKTMTFTVTWIIFTTIDLCTKYINSIRYIYKFLKILEKYTK